MELKKGNKTSGEGPEKKELRTEDEEEEEEEDGDLDKNELFEEMLEVSRHVRMWELNIRILTQAS